MNVEQTLTDELQTVASTVAAPPPPAVTALVRRAERQRTRARVTRSGGTVLVAAAVVAAVVIGSQIGRPTTAPPPANPSPSYYAAGVPYIDEGTLYIGHKPQPGTWIFAESVGAFTAAQRADQSTVILRDGVEVERIDGLVYVLRLSPDGTKAAWIVATGPDAGVLVVRDLVDARELGRLPLVLHPNGDEGLGFSLTVTAKGKVFYDLNDTSWSWTPGGGAPTKTEQPGNDPGPAGFASPTDFAGIDASVRLSPDHLWGAWLTTGSRRQVNVQKPGDSGSRFTIALPDGIRGGPVQWESPTVALVFAEQATEDGRQRIVACDIVTRKCNDATDAYTAP
jgi:hypothetical protein